MLGRYYFKNVASSSIFSSQISSYSEAYHVMDEWRECLGRRTEAGSFIRDTEMDDASTLLTKALNFQARHPKNRSAGGYRRCVYKYKKQPADVFTEFQGVWHKLCKILVYSKITYKVLGLYTCNYSMWKVCLKPTRYMYLKMVH